MDRDYFRFASFPSSSFIFLRSNQSFERSAFTRSCSPAAAASRCVRVSVVIPGGPPKGCVTQLRIGWDTQLSLRIESLLNECVFGVYGQAPREEAFSSTNLSFFQATQQPITDLRHCYLLSQFQGHTHPAPVTPEWTLAEAHIQRDARGDSCWLSESKAVVGVGVEATLRFLKREAGTSS